MSTTAVSAQESSLTGPDQMMIGGEWLPAGSGDVLVVENPATRQPLGSVPRGRAEDVAKAVEAAARAFPAWRRVPARDRGKVLLAISAELAQNREDLARSLAMETGNAIRTQSRPEAFAAGEVFAYFGALASELKGETVPLNEQMLSYTVREPYGVVGGIIPWNSPLSLGSVKVAMALAAGNTMVLKAAEDAPLAILKMAEICSRHLPAGVFNVVTGYGEEAGAALATHPSVRKLSFTGSTEVGRLILAAAAPHIVPTSLELGGKSPTIVFPDATEDAVVDGVIAGMRFTRQGQSCTAGSRLILHESIADDFVGRLVDKLAALKIGDPLDEQSDMGSLINKKQFDRVCEYIANGIAQPGVSVPLGGLPPTEGPLTSGYFVVPTVLTHVDNSWRVAREEIFGPVLAVITWSDLDEAVRIANDTHYGLAAFVWTHDIGRALSTAHAIEAGWVQVNQGIGQLLGQSYGGYKESGIGREASLEGMLDAFTQRKSVTVNLAF